MKEITLEQLLEAGCHFGHQVTRSNPKAREFIYEARDSIHIIDLVKTKQGLEEAGEFIKALASKEGSSLIVVGTKRQARGVVDEILKQSMKQVQDMVQDDKLREGLFYIANRWVGGLLTNFSEVSKNFEKLKEISDNLQNEEFKAKYTKKEIGLWARERQKLEGLYGGVKTLAKKPDALFIIDSHLEDLAVREATQTGVTTVAIVDTNADPDIIDYPIPGNDDAVGSIKLITSYIIDSWIEGRKLTENKKPATTETLKGNEAQKKPATTETQKRREALKGATRKNVSKK